MQNLLAQSQPFAVLTKTELSQLVRVCQELSYRKGEIVFQEGESPKWVWVIKEGRLRLVKRSYGDSEITIDLLTPREAICGISVFDRLPYSATGVAATDCVVVRVPAEEVFNLLQSNPDFSQKILAICCNRIRHMAETCAMLYEPAEQRIAKTLMYLRESFGNILPITHKEIAGITGIRVETTIRLMAKMKRKGCIKISRGQIRLASVEKIKALLAA